MNIACDIRVFLSGETGVGTYFRHLLHHLAAIDGENTYLLFSASWKERFPADRLPPFHHAVLRDLRLPVRVLNHLWHHWRMPAVDRFFREPVTLAHSPTPLPLPSRGRRIVTVHDLFFLDHRADTRGETYHAFFRRFAAGLRRCHGVICVSQATADRFRERFPGYGGPLAVIPHGLHPRFLAGEPVAPPALPPLPERFLFFCGTIEPRKNVPLLLQALAELRRRGERLPLVIAGRPGWGMEEYDRIRPELGQDLIELGYVPAEHLPALYRRATALVFPSLDEGFGFPVLEALAAGTPVVCSSVPALREVGGPHAEYVPVNDRSALAERLLAVWRGETPFDPAAAREYARTFRWETAATRTLEFYRLVAGEAR